MQVASRLWSVVAGSPLHPRRCTSRSPARPPPFRRAAAQLRPPIANNNNNIRDADADEKYDEYQQDMANDPETEDINNDEEYVILSNDELESRSPARVALLCHTVLALSSSVAGFGVSLPSVSFLLRVSFVVSILSLFVCSRLFCR